MMSKAEETARLRVRSRRIVEEVDAARKQANPHRKAPEGAKAVDWAALCDQKDVEILRLRGLFKLYGRHTDNCGYRTGHDCDCGLHDELRKS